MRSRACVRPSRLKASTAFGPTVTLPSIMRVRCTPKRHCRVGNGVNQVVNNLVMLWRKAEILAAERADNKARFEAETFSPAGQPSARTTNQRRCFIFTALTGTYHHAVFMLNEGADFGVINNLTTSGLEDFCHRRRHFAVADNAAGRHKNAPAR